MIAPVRLEVLGGTPIGDVALSQVLDRGRDLADLMEVGDRDGEHGRQFLLQHNED